MRRERQVVGLVPAAGHARRLGDIGCSKEVVEVRGRPVTAHLLERFEIAGVERAFVVLRSGKWDVVERLLGHDAGATELAYLMVTETPSVPHSLDRAYPFLRDADVVLGFPDILFEPADAYARCLKRLRAVDCDLVLGLFPTDQPGKTDMVELDGDGGPRALVIKDPSCSLRFTWSIAAWAPRFTEYLHQWVNELEGTEARSSTEAHVGDVISSGLEDGLAVEAVCFDDGSYLDIGTPEDLRRTSG